MSGSELSWEDPIVRDGFTQRGYIKAVEGLHGELRFTFRPMLPEDVEVLEAFRDRYGVTSPDKARAKIAIETFKRLAGWSVMADGKPLPLSEGNVRRMRMPLQSKLYHIVACLSATDIDPEWSDGLEDLEPLLETAVEKLGK